MIKLKYLHVFCLVILIISCGEDDEVINTIPNAPTNVDVITTNFPEIEVTWNGSVESNNAVYKVYVGACGQAPTANDVFWDCYLSLDNDDDFIGETSNNVFYINNLEPLEGYIVSVIAVDTNGNESEASVGRVFRTIHSEMVTGDINIEDQVDVDFFDGHHIEVLNGNVNIVGKFGSNYGYFNYSITDLSPLNGLREINGNLNIGGFDDNYNFNFESLSGFESLIRIDGDVIFSGSSGLSTSYIQDFFSTIEIGGQLLIL